MDGWIRSYRQMFDNPVVCKDAEHYAVWGYLLHHASHQPYDVVFEGKRITLKPGQLITSRRSIADKFSISDSKVQRILKTFEIEQQIEQQTVSHNRLISLVNWDKYQKSEPQNEPQVNHNRTTSEPQVNTNKNIRIKELENGRRKEKSEKEKSPLTQKELLESLLAEKQISAPLCEKLHEWIAYKSEIKKPYKERGLKTLLNQVESAEQKHGSSAVIACFDKSMGNGYQGVFFDELDRQPKRGGSVRPASGGSIRDMFSAVSEQFEE